MDNNRLKSHRRSTSTFRRSHWILGSGLSGVANRSREGSFIPIRLKGFRSEVRRTPVCFFSASSAMTLNAPGPFGGFPPTHPTVVLKLLFTKDETGYLFGFNGLLLSQLQQYTGADVTMSFGDCDEYVVRVAGSLDAVCHTCNLVCRKLADYCGARHLSVRIVAAGNQCGSIIGRHGAKVNEIRDKTGAAISVFQEFLPNSNERVVEITGDGESCLQCAYHICGVLLESPPKTDTVPYVPVMWDAVVREGGTRDEPPDGRWRPVFLCGDRAYVVDGRVARLAPPELLRKELSKSTLGGQVAASLGRGPDPLALVTAGRQGRTTREMWVRAEPMYRVLEQNRGAVLAEIERMSGARVQLCGPGEVAPSGDVLVTLSGTEDGILLAQFLIQSNLDAASKAAQGRPHFVSDCGGSGQGWPSVGGCLDESASHDAGAFCPPNQLHGGQGPFRNAWRER